MWNIIIQTTVHYFSLFFSLVFSNLIVMHLSTDLFGFTEFFASGSLYLLPVLGSFPSLFLKIFFLQHTLLSPGTPVKWILKLLVLSNRSEALFPFCFPNFSLCCSVCFCPLYSVFYYCVTNYHKLSGLKQHIRLLSHTLCRSGVQTQFSWAVCSGSHMASIKVLVRLHSYLEARLGRHLFPTSFVLLAEFISLQLYDFLVAVSWRLPSHLEAIWFCHVSISSVDTYFVRSWRRIHSSSLQEDGVLYNVISSQVWHPITFGIFYRLKGSHKSHPPSRGWDYTKAWIPKPEDRNHWEGHFRVCLSQSIPLASNYSRLS